MMRKARATTEIRKEAPLRLEAVDVAGQGGDRVLIYLRMSGPAAEPMSFAIDDPARISLDLADTTLALPSRRTVVKQGPLDTVTVAEAQGRTRVVLNMDYMVPYQTRVEGDTIVVNLGSGAAAAAGAAQPVFAAGTPPAAVAEDSAIRDIDFRRSEAGGGRVIVSLTDPSAVIDMRQEAGKIVVDFRKTELPTNLRRRLDVLDFATPVTTVDSITAGEGARLIISATGDFEHFAYQTDEVFTVEVRPLVKEKPEDLGIYDTGKTYQGQRLTLNFQDIETRAVLQLLSEVSGLNMVVSDSVTGNVTLRLRDVPWDQALDIVLATRGLDMRQIDNVIIVAPSAEIAAREKQDLEARQDLQELTPLVSDFIQVNYAKASDLAELLQSGGENSLLSDRGTVSIDQRTNTLLVYDTAERLVDIRRLVQRLDIPVRQVMIESRVVIADNNYARELGVRLGFNRANSFGNNEALIAGSQIGNTPGTGTLDTGEFMGARAGLAPGINGTGPENLLVNLPAFGATSGLNLLVGRVGSFLLQLELTAMQEEGRGELISSPRVITADKSKATIEQGTEIPYATVSNNGTNVPFKDAVLKLEVTPNITPDDRVIMDLVITKDNPNFANSVQGTPAVDTRSVETRVLVDNGETVVLGGVFEMETSKDIDKVPFFGDLPVLGFFFRSTAERDVNRELLFFVTPKILKETLSLR